MDCRTFHKNHVGYVDDTLSAVDTVEMHDHVADCEWCARHDTAVRRSLLLVRNLPTIEPSADFNTRLNARLRELGPSSHLAYGLAAKPAFWGLHRLAAAAAVIATVGTLGLASLELMATPPELALEPVVATRPKPQPPPIASHAIVTSASVGMSVWPTVLTVDQAPMDFVRAEFRQASWTR
ncbi:MAG: zf-HC2 domain-containing protein [Gemmatimonadota bacterium]|nr:zf-HC2 domain-containing protein [Gemmatimonadota bacterium]